MHQTDLFFGDFREITAEFFNEITCNYSRENNNNCWRLLHQQTNVEIGIELAKTFLGEFQKVSLLKVGAD